MNQRRLVLGAAGGGGTLLLVAVLLFAILGPCNLLRGFGRTGSVTHPTPTPTATVTAAATPTPVTTSEPTPTPTPSATAGLIISSLPVHTGEVGVNYSPVQMVASGGKPPYTWSTNPGALPPGLSLTPGGQMAGTPTAAGSYTPTFHVDDSAGGAAGFTAPITIVAALAVRAPCASTCRVEVGCTAACLTAGTQTGGLAPYRYTLAGQLPPGTSFADGLTLAGAVGPVAGAAGPPTYRFAITVNDALGAPAQTADAALTVYPHVAIQGPLSFKGSSRAGFSTQVNFTPGDGTTVAVASGNVPAQLSTPVKANTITISFPPGGIVAQGTYTFTLTLTDQSQCGPNPVDPCTASTQVTIVVGP
jgi:large repetitive protein